MRYKDIKIKSIGDLVAALKKQVRGKEIVWFRGHLKSDWKLVPLLGRKDIKSQAEIALIKRFRTVEGQA